MTMFTPLFFLCSSICASVYACKFPQLISAQPRFSIHTWLCKAAALLLPCYNTIIIHHHQGASFFPPYITFSSTKRSLVCRAQAQHKHKEGLSILYHYTEYLYTTRVYIAQALLYGKPSGSKHVLCA